MSSVCFSFFLLVSTLFSSCTSTPAEAKKAQDPVVVKSTIKKQKSGETKTEPASAPSAEDIPKLLKEIEDKYAQAKTVKADFDQLKISSKLKTRKKTSGSILVLRPDKIRVETKTPEENLLVSDGNTYWFYTPPFDEEEPGELRIYEAKKVQTRFALALLAGSFSDTKTMTIKRLKAGQFELRPKKGAAGDLTRAVMDVDQQEKLVKKVLLVHRGGNQSEIQLRNVKLGENFDKSLFTFKIPPNTEVIKEQEQP